MCCALIALLAASAAALRAKWQMLKLAWPSGGRATSLTAALLLAGSALAGEHLSH